MAFEIVDGMTGTKHISSDDLAALNTATVGKADCVLEYGNDFALTMTSANAATLGTGVGMVGGKRFWNQAAASLTIQSGTQGQKRNDLVVARYAKTSAGIESINPVVIKGTPTADNPADPNTTANDLKLWRIPLNGINAGTPVRLFKPVTPLATLGDSVSHARNALILTEDVRVSGYAGIVSVRHDGFGTVAERYDEAGFVADEETFVQVSGFLWTDNEASDAWSSLVKAPWQPDDLKDYWCIKIPVEVAKKGSGSVSHRTHFDRDCVLYIITTVNGSLVYSGVTTKRLFTSTDGYIYIAMHKVKPDAAPAIIYVDTIVPLSSL